MKKCVREEAAGGYRKTSLEDGGGGGGGGTIGHPNTTLVDYRLSEEWDWKVAQWAGSWLLLMRTGV